MSKLSKDRRDKLILISFAVVAVIGVLYVFVLGAQQDKLHVLGSQISAAKTKLGTAERLVKSADNIEASLTQLKQELETHEKDMAPTGQYYYWFLKTLEEFRKKEGLENSFVVDITQPEFGDVGVLPKFPYRAATFTVHVNGHFQDLGRFLADLENEFPYFRVLNVQVAPEAVNANAPAFGNLGGAPAVAPVSEPKLSMQLKVVTLIKSNGTTT